MFGRLMRFCCLSDVKFGEGKKSFAIGAIVGIVAAFVALLLAIFALWRYKPSVFRDPFKKKDIDCKSRNSIVAHVFTGHCEHTLV